jgi:prepilin-type N-terminal cleavage/methylation domain-containing protein
MRLRISITQYGIRNTSPAFTLIEIMVVVAIMGIVMLTSIPFIRSGLHKETLHQAVRDVEEVCYSARARAIMQGSMAEVVFHPKERVFQVAGAAAGAGGGEAPRPDATTVPPANSGLSGKIPDSLIVDMLDVNLSEYKDSEEARVRFYPNGTSDELTLILHNEKGEYFKMALEATTGLPTFETDPSKFKLQ